MLTFTKMCAIGQMNEYPNKLKIWANKMFDRQHGCWGCISSILSRSHYRTVQCKNDQKLLTFSIMGYLSHADKWHHHSRTRCKRKCLLSFTGTSCWDDSFRSEWMAPVSWGDLCPLPPRLGQSKGSLAHLVGVILTRWLFKVAELCFVKCEFMLHHVVSSQCHKRVKILH